MTDLYRTPLLTARETARHLRIPESTLATWLGAPVPLVHAVDPERSGWPRIPFVGVVEAHVLRSLRDLGLSMAEVRHAADLVRSEFGDPYALARQRIATDGVRLFVRLADEALVHAGDDQLALSPGLEDAVRRITWDAAGDPVSLRLGGYPDRAAVVIDPRFGWGAPVLAASRVPLSALLALAAAGEPAESVADEFGLPLGVVEDVLHRAA